eukprot:NODE_12937_length_220_cov_16.912281_g11167_i0.p4 GENE.NODE_12937_length_220_cov_16.912281_g11167_i0~~NODE_12937_length_220_cov_16.912281_g11167_i0.p4  ORF type:complete len:53 (+),score=29.76 NODE_12937_length_220_cov_16.912281_g11167_i0:24-161(+)
MGAQMQRAADATALPRLGELLEYFEQRVAAAQEDGNTSPPAPPPA